MIARTVIAEFRPDCKVLNYVYLGDITTDNSVNVRCWQCKHRWIVLKSEKHADTNNAFLVEGEPGPR